MKSLSTPEKVISWICQLAAAGLLLQTLFFKFTGAPESIYIFETVGMEPWGRYGSGIVELIAAILLFIPRKAWIGAILALGVISGALFFHLTSLGIVIEGVTSSGTRVPSDGGTLFYLAITVFIASLIVLFIRGRQAMRRRQ